MNGYLVVVFLLVTISVARAQESSPTDTSGTAAEGETVDLRHHWKRPYSYGYSNNHYGYSSYPSNYYNNYGYGYYPQQQQYYQPFYPSYGYSNYYSNSYQYGENYYGLGYREGDKKEPVKTSAGDEVKFN